MAKWNESNRRWEADETLLTDAELAQCTRACDDDRYSTPIPTQIISNGEYMPLPQSEQQKRVELRVKNWRKGRADSSASAAADSSQALAAWRPRSSR